MRADRHNVLLLLADQWPAWAFGHRGANVRTPSVDRLASEGTVFTNAFTSCPLCSPARAALLTARWATQTGLCDNIGVGYSTQGSLDPGERTWIDEAVRAGYHVGYFGKWHLGVDGPIERGAHRHSASFDAGARPYDPTTDTHSYEAVRDRYRRHEGELIRGRPPFWGVRDVSREATIPFRLARDGVGFIEEYSSAGMATPFFLAVSINPPHFPHYLPREYADLADPAAASLPASLGDAFEGKPAYHGRPWWPSMDTSGLTEDDWRMIVSFSRLHITLVDEAIGRVLDALDRHALADRTLVVFTADHGDMQGAHNRFDKGPYFYDEVWRIPLVVRAPGAAPARQDSFVSILDVGRTLLHAVGASDDPDRPRAGRDVASLVGTTGRPQGWPQVAFGAYDLYNGMSFAIRAVRDERCTYVWNPQACDELYDHGLDPAELVNLAGREDHKAVEGSLRDRLFDWMRETGDDLPSRAPALPPAGTIVATGRMGP